MGAIERGLKLGLLGVEVLDGGIRSAIDLDDGDAQIVFGFVRDFDLAAQMRKLGFAFVEQPRLLDEAVFQIFPGAPVENFVVGALRR